jgi:hypothetical protein
MTILRSRSIPDAQAKWKNQSEVYYNIFIPPINFETHPIHKVTIHQTSCGYISYYTASVLGLVMHIKSMSSSDLDGRPRTGQ